ncbi:MAG: hypothetical protein ACK4E5_00445 [Erythrobacter cryptus]
MTRFAEALLAGGLLIALALLAILEAIPAEAAQFAPLALLPLLLRRRRACAGEARA